MQIKMPIEIPVELMWPITVSVGAAIMLLMVFWWWSARKKSQENASLQLNVQQLQQQTQHLVELIHNQIQQGLRDTREQTLMISKQNHELLASQVARLTEITQDNLHKASLTFSDILQRLALIDEAQKRMTELSSQVIDLQTLLADKRARGTFGEVQLSQLLRNVLTESQYALQYTLSNGKRADCVLFLPKPIGQLTIDAKFPLENFQRMLDTTLDEIQRKRIAKQFCDDVLNHIKTIAEKYIIPNETASGAIMFIPAESIFAEIHAHFPEIIAASQRQQVWLVSPTTMMAILTTVSAVMKDEATRQQVHEIQQHLNLLAKDFARFHQRIQNLTSHMNRAQQDVQEINLSADKILSRFTKIEQVDLTTYEKEHTATEY